MAIHAQPQLYQENLGFNMENDCGFIEPYLNTQKQERQSYLFQQQKNHLLQQNQQMNQNTSMQYGQSAFVPTPPINNMVSNNDQFSVAYSQSLAAQMDAQRQQLDHYLGLQGESLRLMMQEQRKQQLGLLMKKLELKTTTLLTQKDAEIAHASKRQMELEGLLRKLETEGQEWQKIAQENEAKVESLNNTLEELRECCISNNALEDAESCCNVNMMGDIDDVEQMRTRRMMVCRGCNSRKVCMLFLPCRHLSACKTCEPFLGCCPVCTTTKKAGVEVLL